MKVQELRQLSTTELTNRLKDTVRGYYELREHVVAGKEKNHAKLKDARRDVARLKTLIAQKYE